MPYPLLFFSSHPSSYSQTPSQLLYFSNLKLTKNTERGREAKGSMQEAVATHVVAAVTHVLERLVARNDGLDVEPPPTGLVAFCAARAPTISIGKYMERIQRYTECSPSCFVVGFVYIDRVIHRWPTSLVVSLNVHRLILTSVLIASKVLDDMHHNNAFYAKVGGLSNSELNRLELELLFLLDFQLVVSSRAFESYCLYLEKELMGNQTSMKIHRAIANSADGELDQPADAMWHASSPTLLHIIE